MKTTEDEALFKVEITPGENGTPFQVLYKRTTSTLSGWGFVKVFDNDEEGTKEMEKCINDIKNGVYGKPQKTTYYK